MCKNSISKLLPKTSKDGLACFFVGLLLGPLEGLFFFLPKRVRVWNCGGGPAVLGPLACSLGPSYYVLPCLGLLVVSASASGIFQALFGW